MGDELGDVGRAEIARRFPDFEVTFRGRGSWSEGITWVAHIACSSDAVGDVDVTTWEGEVSGFVEEITHGQLRRRRHEGHELRLPRPPRPRRGGGVWAAPNGSGGWFSPATTGLPAPAGSRMGKWSATLL